MTGHYIGFKLLGRCDVFIALRAQPRIAYKQGGKKKALLFQGEQKRMEGVSRINIVAYSQRGMH